MPPSPEKSPSSNICRPASRITRCVARASDAPSEIRATPASAKAARVTFVHGPATSALTGAETAAVIRFRSSRPSGIGQ